MPSKHTIRNFYNGGFYHIYNRGVAKQNIYRNHQDYIVFLYYLKAFLSPPDKLDEDEPFYDYRRKNYYGQLRLHSYCLMPNHFHLFASQQQENGVSEFMRALSNAYTKYFNNQNNRVGSLFQGTYKAAEVSKEAYYLHLSRYIHLNPLDTDQMPASYDYSSLKYYLNNKIEKPLWLDVETVRGAIGSADDYQEFMLSAKGMDQIENIMIDNEY